MRKHWIRSLFLKVLRCLKKGHLATVFSLSPWMANTQWHEKLQVSQVWAASWHHAVNVLYTLQ